MTRPTTIAAATAPAEAETMGRVTSTIRRGEIFLHPKGDKLSWFRLRWSPDDEARERHLPPGTYVVTGYRQLATAEDGTPWIWSTTSVGYRELEVKAGESTHLDVRASIEVRARAVFKRGNHRVGLLFLAEKKLGNTLYRDGKRIEIRWLCLDADGKVLAEGPMRYG